MDLFQGEGAALLIQALLSLRDEAECRAFLEDLMTSREIQDCGQRLLVARLLRENMVYSRIAQATGASSATISRVRRSMLDNGAGGVMREVILRTGLDKQTGETQRDKE